MLMIFCWIFSSTSALAITTSSSQSNHKIVTKNALSEQSWPVIFVPNVGQWPSERFYAAQSGPFHVALEAQQVRLQIHHQHQHYEICLRPLAPEPSVQLQPGQRALTQVNYLRGSNPHHWHTQISTHQSVRYQDLYPAVDWVWRGQDSHIAYDFVVAPGASPDQIQIAVEGVKALTLTAEGAMLMTLPNGEQIQQAAPVIYQLDSDQRISVAGHFQLQPSITNASGQKIPVYGFHIAAYDPTRPLIIDPTIRGTSFVGGEGDDTVQTLVVTDTGEMLVAGYTDSESFTTAPTIFTPATNATGGGLATPMDGIIYKINAAGNAFSFVTVLAGDGDDEIHDLAIDADGNIYVTGTTNSTDFAFNALYPVLSGSSNAFIAKFNPNASSLLFATYFGGTGTDSAEAIALDGQGNIYIAGKTNSTDLILRNPLYTQLRGSTDGFIASFTNDGQALRYATYFGGTGNDSIDELTVSTTGDLFFAGNTASTNLPMKHEIQSSGGGADLFLARIARGGGELVFSTYLGGRGTDVLTDMTLDEQGHYLLSGYTGSEDFPVTSGVLSTSNAGNDEGILVKVDRSGRFVHFATYISALEDERAFAVARDQTADSQTGLYYLYVAGQTNSHFFPVQNPTQNYHAGGADGFILKLDPCGQQLWYSSYFGGASDDAIIAIGTQPNTGSRELFIVGETAEETDSALFPIQIGVPQFTHGGGIDHFVAHITDIDNTRITNDPELILGCNPIPFVPERSCPTCGGVELALYLSDPMAVGISAFSTTITYDPSEIQFRNITWDPSLPLTAHKQHESTVPGELTLTIYQPIGAANFTALDGTIARLAFDVVDVGRITDNPPLPSRKITLSQTRLSAADIQALDTVITGLDGSVTITRRCNGLIGDCDCSGQVQIFEVQAGVDYFAGTLPAAQPYCLKRDYNAMVATDLQEVINNYNNRVIEEAVTEQSSMTRWTPQPRAVVASTSQLTFNPVQELTPGIWSYDLMLNTVGQSISVLATDIRYDPQIITDIRVDSGGATLDANKQLAYSIVQDGWLRIVFYGINDTTFPSGHLARIHMTTADGRDCQNISLTQEVTASTPFAEQVPIEGQDNEQCQAVSAPVDRSSLAWQITEIYIATMGYAPDAEGLNYWVEQINRPASVWTTLTVAESFFDQNLVRDRYADMANSEFINTLYGNIFNRTPDTEGYNYWLTALSSDQVARNQMIISLINGGYDNEDPQAQQDMARFANLVRVGLAFAERQTELGIIYNQLSPADQQQLRQFGADILNGVTHDPVTAEAAIADIPNILR
jgi:hypothetical protein